MQNHRLAEKYGWQVGLDFPEWGNNDLYLTTIKGGYLNAGETPSMAYRRLAKTASKYLNDPSLEDRFYSILWKGWLIPSTPVMCNMGTDRGLPISCFGSVVGDDMYEIGRKQLEMRMLSKYGGGTSYDFSKIRPIGSPIKGGNNGISDGQIPFIKSYDSTIISSKQGKTRRGAAVIYNNVNHPEFLDFLEIREPVGDINRQCHNIHIGAILDDEFMHSVRSHDGKEREIWIAIQKKRVKTGEPYIFYIDNANKVTPHFWKELKLWINHSNLCTEIMLPNDEEHTFVCCISSLNLYKWDEWKDTDTVFLSTIFLDAVISDFVEKGTYCKGIEDAIKFAIKSRALGLGTLGWHSLLQSKSIPFISIASNGLTTLIYRHIDEESKRATKWLASKFGEPEWCKGQGIRNLTRMTVAPNRSSSKLAGEASQGVEPYAGALWVDNDAKGTHIRRNPEFEKLLKSKGIVDTLAIWDEINEAKGSVQKLSILTDHEKEVFRTFREINQLELVKQAAIRQAYIDQGQSINLAFHQDAPAKFINQVHLAAWELGLKSLYYLRSESILRADTNGMRDLYSECIMCEG